MISQNDDDKIQIGDDEEETFTEDEDEPEVGAPEGFSYHHGYG